LCLETIKREEGKGKLGFKKEGVEEYTLFRDVEILAKINE